MLVGARVESRLGHESVRAHDVENPRRFLKRLDLFNRPDAGRVPLAGDRLRALSLRWRPERALAAAAGSAPSLEPDSQARQCPRRDAMDRDSQWAGELE